MMTAHKSVPPVSPGPTPEQQPRESLSARLLSAFVPALKTGHLTIVTPAGDRLNFAGKTPGPHGTVILRRWGGLWRCLLDGETGFAEAYMDGEWSTPDIVALLDLGVRNSDRLRGVGTSKLPLRIFNRLRHSFNANTKRGSRRNIAAHYDLGNDFYKQWLDAGMSYSSAIYASPDQPLEDAQNEKLVSAIDMMNLSGGERVLEIGCGWGAMAERLIEKHDCHVTGVTLSSQQLAYAQNRLMEKQLLQKADLRLQDYRDIDEQFDRIVAIEMLEAVGEKYWPVFFGKLRERLKPGGTAVLQVISIKEHRFDDYRKTPDFIQQYIFPGGMLPTVPLMKKHIDNANLSLELVETFGESYARTLAEWQLRFQRAWADIQKLDFDIRFKRMWEYYLAYCEVGFRTGATDVGLYRIRRT